MARPHRPEYAMQPPTRHAVERAPRAADLAEQLRDAEHHASPRWDSEMPTRPAVPDRLPRPPQPARPSTLPGRAQQWVMLLVFALGAGGVPSLVQAIRGDSQKRDIQDLAAQVRSLQGAVGRLEAQGAATERSLVDLAATVRVREEARKERDALIGSYLSQRSPDVATAKRLLKLDGLSRGDLEEIEGRE